MKDEISEAALPSVIQAAAAEDAVALLIPVNAAAMPSVLVAPQQDDAVAKNAVRGIISSNSSFILHPSSLPMDDFFSGYLASVADGAVGSLERLQVDQGLAAEVGTAADEAFTFDSSDAAVMPWADDLRLP